jgi:hypothetical protein
LRDRCEQIDQLLVGGAGLFGEPGQGGAQVAFGEGGGAVDGAGEKAFAERAERYEADAGGLPSAEQPAKAQPPTPSSSPDRSSVRRLGRCGVMSCRGLTMLLQSSGMGRPKASRVIASGSGPPRWPVSRASIGASSSAVRWKSKTSRFSTIRAGWVDFGITERPF